MVRAPGDLQQRWPVPSAPRPIVIIGAGGIVADAHLPAYARAGLPVAAIFDVDRARATTLAERFNVPRTLDAIGDAPRDAIFDVAVPPERVTDVLPLLPDDAAVLIQKPMGLHLAMARQIRQLCRSKRLVAAINFQLRFAPMMLAMRDAIARGLLGRVLDVEMRMNVRTPWELFAFLNDYPRCEIQIHTVHYLDLTRGLFGDPAGVWAQTVGDPRFALASTKSSIVLDYGRAMRAIFSINHNYDYGGAYQSATYTVQGDAGCAVCTFGVSYDYPKGRPDRLEIATRDGDRIDWSDVPLVGGWFPDAFAGPMSNLQRFVAGEDERLQSSIDDAFRTMALVEACYDSHARGATPIPQE